MKILTKDGIKELPEEEVIGAYASNMLMPIQRARNYFKTFMAGATPFPVQGLGFVVPERIMEDAVNLDNL